MDPRMHRTPSPGHPVNHGYQLEDAPAFNRQNSASPAPYGQHNLDIPMGPTGGRLTPSDRMLPQPTVRNTSHAGVTQLTTAAVLCRKHKQLLWPQ